MYYRGGSWLNFSADVLGTVRTAFLERKPIIEATIDGAKCIIDCKRMLQINFSTGNWRSVSWIDDDGKCFFPNGFFCDEELCENKTNRSPDIEIVDKINQTSWKRKRANEPNSSSAKSVRVNVIRPANWSNSKRLRETEKSYFVVKSNFLYGIRRVDSGVTITSIHICNWEEHADKPRHVIFQYQAGITKAARGTANVTYAWYGASAENVESVLAHGFGSHSKVPATEVYGIGVYLSPLGFPHLSANLAEADENGVKHLILCRVILGKVEKVEAGSQQYLSSSVDFDTGSNDPSNPRWYVVWSNNANLLILPESVVSFKSSSNTQGQPREVCSLEKLFSKIGSCLPPAKIQEISNSYRSYRTRGMTQDDFIRKLLLVAGEEFLQSAALQIFASPLG